MLCKQLYMYLHLLRFFKCLLQYQRSEFPNTGKCLSTILGLVQGLFAVNYYIFFNFFFFLAAQCRNVVEYTAEI